MFPKKKKSKLKPAPITKPKPIEKPKPVKKPIPADKQKLVRNKLKKVIYLYKIYFVQNQNDNRPDYSIVREEFYPEIRAKEIVLNGLNINDTYFSPQLIRKVRWEKQCQD